jgi:hypothetical protein
MRSVASLLVFLLLLTNLSLAGAASGMPEPGARVRITVRLPKHERWTGSFVSLANDTVTIRDSDSTGVLVTVAAPQITRFEVSRGNRGSGMRGAGFGLLVGVAVGAVVGYAGYSGDDYLVSSAGESAGAGAALFGFIGAGVGAVVGALTPSEHWRDLPLVDLRSTAGP